MLNSLRIQNFKSWQDTGTIQFGSLTGFFGTNSSGKTSILQFLLMLKQTVESSDRAQILNLGDERSYVELGTMHDIFYNHSDESKITFALEWQSEMTLILPVALVESSPNKELTKTFSITRNITSSIRRSQDHVTLEEFTYSMNDWEVGVRREKGDVKMPYRLENSISKISSTREHPVALSRPIKFYGFPPEAYGYFRDANDVEDFVFYFESNFTKTYYLGPLREYPKRLYSWAGEQTEGVGNRGERSIAALLASRQQGITIALEENQEHTLEQHVAYWLKELGLIYSFEVRPIAPNRKEYEVRVKRTAESTEVFLTDVGFGVSQLLPVLVLLFYVPEGSTIILEQPEIHLHPAVQAGLADVFIDAIKRRNVQIILESHSEHLLQRLQRRLAEEALPTDQVKLYFTDFVGAASTLTPLDLDAYGNIRNWPKNFFGDSFADASAMMDAELKRREAAGEQ